MTAKANSNPLQQTTKDFTRDTIKIRVSFSGRGSGETKSERVADAAATAEHADRDSIKGAVVVIHNKFMSPVTSAFGAVERFWKYGDGEKVHGTKPWEDGGYRLGPVSEYNDLRAGLDQRIREALDAVRKHIGAKYDEIKKDAEARGVTKLMPNGFPSKSDLLARFDIQVFIDKIASAEDFRFSGLSDKDVEALAQKRQQGLETLILQSNQACLDDAIKAVSNLRATLEDPKKRFNGCEEIGYPILEAVQRMIDRAESFNWSADARLTDTIAKARKLLKGINLTAAKEDPKARKEAASAAKTIEDELAAF